MASDNVLWAGTDMRALLIVEPQVAIVPPLLVNGGLHVVCLQAIPLHETERQFKSRTSAEHLLRQFERRSVPFWDGSRRAVPLN